MSSWLLERLAARPLLRRLVWPLVTFLAILVVGITGFYVVAGASLVEAVFWLLDPTSIELHFQTSPGPEQMTKLFAVLIAGGLVLSTLWAGETVLSAVTDGEVRQEIQRAQEDRRLMQTDDHVIVCGYGIFGRTIGRELAGEGDRVVVIEIEPAEADEARKDGFLAVTGDARRERVLRNAELSDARALVAAVDDSNINIQVAIVASELAPEVETTVRVGDEMYESVARRAGADLVVIPETMTGGIVAEQIGEERRPAEGGAAAGTSHL